MSKNRSGLPLLRSPAAMGTAGIIAAGIFVVCAAFLLADNLFASNSADVPKGLDTATIAPASVPAAADAAVTEPPQDNNAQGEAAGDESSPDESAPDETDAPEEPPAAEEPVEKAIVTDYVQLRTAPDNEAEAIVCLSPNLEVTVISRDDEGYCLVSFYNFGTDYTEGYVYGGFLVSAE